LHAFEARQRDGIEDMRDIARAVDRSRNEREILDGQAGGERKASR